MVSGSIIFILDSVQLFRDRVLMNKPDFELDEDNSQAVSAICQKLDGIPLAIEMAASRIKMMDPDTILNRLSDQLRILSGGPRTASPEMFIASQLVPWLKLCRLSPKKKSQSRTR